jgi:serine/threonine protein kinase
VQQFVDAWERGDCPPAEEFLASRGLAAESELAVRLIYEEFCLRREGGSNAPSQEILRRFPQWRSELEMLLDCERLLSSANPSRFPEVGEEIGPFRLLSELGRGAMGRVYLASQPALSDRPVVVKLTPQTGQEHLSLARLQHTGIVPLYLAQNIPERNVRVLCMPYLGGVTLDQLMTALADNPVDQRAGRDIAKVIEAAARREGAAPAHVGPALQFLQRASYAQAVCWIGASLAEALHYAHQRGLCHFDLKPSNVLLAGDGQPMLLDFHLARGPLAAGTREAWLGGTPGHMAPEHQAAMVALREGRAVVTPVDHRADMYSLALVLDALLGNVVTDENSRPMSNSGVEASLHALLRQCLSPSPDARKHDAATLANELRQAIARWSAARTAHGADEASERHHISYAWMTVAVFAIALVIASVAFSVRLNRAESALETVQSQLDRHAGAERREQLTARLKSVIDQLRWQELQGTPEAQAAQNLDAACRAVWEQREGFIQVATVHPAVRRPIREQLTELALLWADAQSVTAPENERADAHRQAALLLDAAERELGAHPMLNYERRRHAVAAGMAPSDDWASLRLPTVHATWEHYALARALRRENRHDEAHEILRRAAAEDPRHAWIQFSLGENALRRQDYQEALAAYSAAIALAPNRRECYQRRAAVYRAIGRNDLAWRDQAEQLKRSEGDVQSSSP